MKEHYFLNFGAGKDSRFDYESNDEANTARLDAACKKHYGAGKQVKFNIKGVEVAVCTYGIHRAVRLNIPHGASQETRDAFQAARTEGMLGVATPYNLLTHNCVTTVSQVLHGLDPNITPSNMTLPSSLDRNVNSYIKTKEYEAKEELAKEVQDEREQTAIVGSPFGSVQHDEENEHAERQPQHYNVSQCQMGSQRDSPDGNPTGNNSEKKEADQPAHTPNEDTPVLSSRFGNIQEEVEEKPPPTPGRRPGP